VGSRAARKLGCETISVTAARNGRWRPGRRRCGSLTHEQKRSRVEEAERRARDHQRLGSEPFAKCSSPNQAVRLEVRDDGAETGVAADRRGRGSMNIPRHQRRDAGALLAAGARSREQREMRRDHRVKAHQRSCSRGRVEAGRRGLSGAEWPGRKSAEEGAHQDRRAETTRTGCGGRNACARDPTPSRRSVRRSVHEAADEDQRADARRQQQRDRTGRSAGVRRDTGARRIGANASRRGFRRRTRAASASERFRHARRLRVTPRGNCAHGRPRTRRAGRGAPQ